MRSTDRLVMVLLVLMVVMVAGMLTASWRVVLYPYLFIVGIVILLGVGTRRGRDKVLVGYAGAITGIYLVLYVWLETAMHRTSGASTDLVLGLVPATAIYFFAIWPIGLIAAACYGFFYERILSDPPSESSRRDGAVPRTGADS